MKGLIVFALTCLTVGLAAAAAEARPGAPPFSFTVAEVAIEGLDHVVLPRVDVAALRQEDLASYGKPGVPYRIAKAVPKKLSVPRAGTLEVLDDGGRLWRLRVTSKGATFLSFTFADFALPPGAELLFVSVDREFHDGPYTARNNNSYRRFGSPIVPGDSAVIELYVPPDTAFEPALVLESVSHGYRDYRGVSRVPFREGRGPAELPRAVAKVATQATCEVDINCPEGAEWQDDKRAVAETFDGQFICTGTLLNNVRQDCRNFFLTANHCTKSKGKAAGLVFFWNYENSGCNTGDANFNQTSTGSNLRAGNAQSDFTLLELFSPPDPSFFVFHAGWNRSNVPASSGIAIHHPNDLPKKISFEFDPIQDGGNFSGGWGDDHWRVTGWDIGTTEPGSSGSGLWNPAHQVVGQLHGGTADCSGGWDEYGKLSVSWTSGLSQWLDPDGTGAISVNGKDCNAGSPPPPPTCNLGKVGDPCTVDADCCSNTCRGPSGRKTCK